MAATEASLRLQAVIPPWNRRVYRRSRAEQETYHRLWLPCTASPGH